MKRVALSLPLALSLFAACHHRPKIAAAPAAWLEPKANELGAISAPGSTRAPELLRGVVYDHDDIQRDFHVALDPANCYWFSGVGDESVKKLYIYAFDPSDHRVGSIKSDSPMNVLMVCPELPGMFRVQVKVDEGAGHFVLAIFSKPAGAKPAPPPAAAPEDLEAMIEKQASSAAPGAKRVGEFFAGSTKTGEKSDWFTALDPANCYWIIGAGGKGVKKLFLYLWDPDTKRVADNLSDNPTSVLGHCPKQGGMFKFEAKVDSGSGEYKVGIYAKPR